jgi:hypothetical protein
MLWDASIAFKFTSKEPKNSIEPSSGAVLFSLLDFVTLLPSSRWSSIELCFKTSTPSSQILCFFFDALVKKTSKYMGSSSRDTRKPSASPSGRLAAVCAGTENSLLGGARLFPLSSSSGHACCCCALKRLGGALGAQATLPAVAGLGIMKPPLFLSTAAGAASTASVSGPDSSERSIEAALLAAGRDEFF